MARNDWQRKQTQVVLADLEPWQQQLYEEHRVRIRAVVLLPVAGDRIRPGVRLVAYRVRVGPSEEVVHEDWRTIELMTSGTIEKAILEMASRLLLDLEADRERAQRQSALPF